MGGSLGSLNDAGLDTLVARSLISVGLIRLSRDAIDLLNVLATDFLFSLSFFFYSPQLRPYINITPVV